MNFFPLIFVVSFVFCADRAVTKNKTKSTSGEEQVSRFEIFKEEYLPCLGQLSQLTYVIKEGTVEELAGEYAGFFNDVTVQFALNKTWEATFWAQCNDHFSFVVDSRISLEAPVHAILETYGVCDGDCGDAEHVRVLLQKLYCDNFELVIHLEKEAMYLFLAFLVHSVPHPPVPDFRTLKSDLITVSTMKHFPKTTDPRNLRREIRKIQSETVKQFMMQAMPLYLRSKASDVFQIWCNDVLSVIYARNCPNLEMGQQGKNAMLHILNAYRMPHTYKEASEIRLVCEFDAILKKYFNDQRIFLLDNASLFAVLSYLAFYLPVAQRILAISAY